MGREIEKILLDRGHDVKLVIDEANADELTAENLQGIDVAFEFTTPDTALHNVRTVLAVGGRVVCGTTGWLASLGEMQQLATEAGGALFYASNFSIGVNMKDAPSGTAITLAEGIIEQVERKTSWANEPSADASVLEIESFREGMVPGIHTVTYTSEDDFIELKHSITNRRALAMGAVLAGEYLCDKQGVHTMDDLL